MDWKLLGDRFELAGGAIRNAVVRAATRAALRLSGAAAPAVTMEDLLAEAQEETTRGDGSGGASSGARAMYM